MSLPPHPTLRFALLIDAFATGAICVMLMSAAGAASRLFGLPEVLLFWLSLALIPFVVFVIVLVRRPTLRRGTVRLVITFNIIWVIDSVALLLSGWVTPTLLGTAFVMAQALGVAGFAGLQAYGLHRSLATPVTSAHA